YDPVQVDPEGGVKPGTKFQDLPDDWRCPICGQRRIYLKKSSQKSANFRRGR
ncbi:MAG: hypothetical protein CO171_03165, partial [Syntrophobacterales bacterium CG_4_9_14_3_um_filter_49_8]